MNLRKDHSHADFYIMMLTVSRSHDIVFIDGAMSSEDCKYRVHDIHVLGACNRQYPAMLLNFQLGCFTTFSSRFFGSDIDEGHSEV